MTPENKEAAEVILLNREYIYTLMHRVFAKEPDEELMTAATADSAAQAFALLSEEPDDILARTPAFLGRIHREMTEPDFYEKLKSEYTHLFIGPGKLIAPPWESVYQGEDDLLFQEVTLEVRRFYKSFQLQPEDYPHVADDSLTLELAFMTKLAERSVKALKAEDMSALKTDLEGSCRFLKEHMLVWVPMFLERIRKSETDVFYPRFCFVLDSFLKQDKKALEEILAIV